MGHSASRYAAFAGLQHALLMLRFNPGWSAGIEPTTMPGNKSVSYAVEITNNLNGTLPVNLGGGIVVPPGSVYCASMGINESDESQLQLHAMTGIMAQGNPTIAHAAFTDNTFSLSDTAQSSSFDPATVGFTIDGDQRAVPTTLNSEGAVGSNRYADIGASTQINGDLYKPADLALTLASGLVSGNVIPMSDPVAVPVLDPPVDFTSPLAAMTDPAILTSTTPDDPKVIRGLTLTAGTMTVDPGRYFFPDGIDINGHIELSPSVDSDHPVLFFVGNDAEFKDGARVNVAGETRNFQVVMVDLNDGSPQNFSMEGKSQVFGAVLAGQAEGVISDQANLFGGFMGRSLSCSDSAQIVYDESLSTSPLTISTAWGLHGVTEPKPEIILASYPVMRTSITTLSSHSMIAAAPVSLQPVMTSTGIQPISGFQIMTAQPLMLANPNPIIP
jgi:hypothetical protein